MAKRTSAAAARWGAGDSGALEILELLAAQAPLQEIDEVLLRVHDRGASADELARIHRAGRLGRTVHGLLSGRRRRELDLAALIETSRDLMGACDVDGLLKVVAQRARQLLDVDVAVVTLLTSKDGDSVVRASAGVCNSFHTGIQLTGGRGIGAVVRATGAPFWTSDYLTEPDIDHDPALDAMAAREGVRSVLALPLHHDGGSVGVLYLGQREVRPFEPAEVALMGSLTDLAAVAIDKAQWVELYNAEVAKLEEHSALAMETIEAERRLEVVRDHILGLALSARGLAALADEVGILLDGEAIVRDHQGGVVAGRESAFPAPQLPAPAPSPRPPVLLDGGVWQASVWAGTTWLGHLLFRPRTPLDPEGERILAYTAQASAVALRMRAGASELIGPH
ncbi:GAF domain-containing protein [Streptomyces sp. NPDC020719]|uniref:GAF domain-containing protein n=1 Tax=unclassified Streptomyces TaxID=2593676 RepID=UPI0033E2AC89